jgi:hypothetical protein
MRRPGNGDRGEPEAQFFVMEEDNDAFTAAVAGVLDRTI